MKLSQGMHERPAVGQDPAMEHLNTLLQKKLHNGYHVASISIHPRLPHFIQTLTLYTLQEAA